MSATLNVIVAGAGVFGRHHLRVYRELEQTGVAVRLQAIVDPDATAAQRVSAEFSVPAFASIDACIEALGAPTAASVCVPTAHHAAVAAPLLRRGVHCLVEKPLAATLPQADELLALARAHGATLQVGHLERFNPAVTAARLHLRRPMFFEAHRLSIFTPRSLDVDVVLDLMIHDLDIVLSLVESPVRELRAVGLPVLSPKVDIANVRVEFENGCVANFTASRVSTERVRKLRFFQLRQYLSLDFARQDLLLIDVGAGAKAGGGAQHTARIAGAAGSAPIKPGVSDGSHGGAHPSAGLSLLQVPVTPGEPLRLEIAAFLECIASGSQPRVTGQAGRAALALALEINEAMRLHAERSGLLAV